MNKRPPWFNAYFVVLYYPYFVELISTLTGGRQLCALFRIDSLSLT